MYRIVVCGEQNEIKAIAMQCEAFLTDKNIAGTVSVTSQAEKLLLLGRKEGEKINLLLFDTEGDRMAIAEKLREKHPALSMILYSSDLSQAFEGYQLRAGGFLPKPVEQAQLFRALLREYENRFLKTFLPVGEENVRLDMIRYLEIAGKKVAVHLENGEALYINGKLDDIAQKLFNGTGNNLFVRCHQSYLVNLRHVESMQRYLLVFADGEELPVSKAYTKEVQQAFLEYEN